MNRLSISAALLLFGAVSAAEPIDPKQFDDIRDVVKPTAAEQKWEKIRWFGDLWEARREAARHGKPILLWEMDGHPLGCT